MLRTTRIFQIVLIWVMTSEISIAGPTSKTPWVIVNSSLGELLNSGWIIVNQSSNRVVIAPYTNGASDEVTYTYLLHKNGKYVNCFILNPRPDNASSACRQLN
jgi:hypothetical protein